MIDVRRLQELVQEAWRVAGPKVEWHVGDVAWIRWKSAGPETDPVELREGAWGWLHRGRELYWLVHPELKRSRIQRELLGWFEDVAVGEGVLRTWAFDDDAATVEVLAAAGFEREQDGTAFSFNARDLGEEQGPDAREGFELRSVRDGDLHRRVAIHRTVWHPSQVTDESYASVMRAWPYRPDLDFVAEASDGRFAAYALAWYDDANRVAELEPVGTHPDFRRQGLGAAVCRHAFRRLHEAGAERVVVYSATEPAQRLYESLGFRRHAFLVPFVKVR